MKLRSQPRRRTLAVFGSVLTVATTVWIVTRPERKEVVGRVDPALGYRCRFTLSSLWQGEYRPLSVVDADSGWKIDLDYYVCTPRPSPVTQWMNSHLLHLPSANAPEIRLTTYRRS